MSDELAGANVNRAYSLTASSIAIFTFLMFFLFPRFQSGTINLWLFQVMLVVMGVATFSFVFASFYYYCCSVGGHRDESELARFARRADRFWLLGYSLLILAPSLVLFTVGLFSVGYVWAGLWLAYLVFALVYFPRIQAARKSSK